MKITIFSILVLLALPALAANLRVEMFGCVPGKEVRVALYASAADFSADTDGKNAMRKQIIKANDAHTTVSFTDLPDGRYAIAAFADVNGNQRLDSNLLGVPSEPYGFSKDARSALKKPSFEEAAFDVQDADLTQVIHLH